MEVAMTTPKLSELSDIGRRVMCAEAIGWKYECMHFGEPFGEKPKRREGHIFPNPDEDANDALKLVEHANRSGAEFHLSQEAGLWFCRCDWDSRDSTAPESTLPRSIVSAFLLASGLAVE
jgi:hypothetical protein